MGADHSSILSDESHRHFSTSFKPEHREKLVLQFFYLKMEEFQSSRFFLIERGKLISLYDALRSRVFIKLIFNKANSPHSFKWGVQAARI